jgi:hypothetical protein
MLKVFIKIPVILVRFLKNMHFFLDNFSRNTQNIKINENPSHSSTVVPCGQTDGWTEMKLIVAFCNFANTPGKIVASGW